MIKYDDAPITDQRRHLDLIWLTRSLEPRTQSLVVDLLFQLVAVPEGPACVGGDGEQGVGCDGGGDGVPPGQGEQLVVERLVDGW